MTATPSKHVDVDHVMGTAVTRDVRAPIPPSTIDAALTWLHEVDAESTAPRTRLTRRPTKSQTWSGPDGALALGTFTQTTAGAVVAVWSLAP